MGGQKKLKGIFQERKKADQVERHELHSSNDEHMYTIYTRTLVFVSYPVVKKLKTTMVETRAGPEQQCARRSRLLPMRPAAGRGRAIVRVSRGVVACRSGCIPQQKQKTMLDNGLHARYVSKQTIDTLASASSLARLDSGHSSSLSGGKPVVSPSKPMML